MQPNDKDVPMLAKALRYVLLAVFAAVVGLVAVNVVRFVLDSRVRAELSPAPPEEPVYLDKAGKRITEFEYRIGIGYETAKARGFTHHDHCRALPTVGEAEGCHRYVTAQKGIGPYIPQRDFASGKTSAQCREEVNAHFAPLIADTRERGDDRAASVWTRTRWEPELRRCANYDNLRIAKVVHEPAARLAALLRKAEQGEPITDADRLAVTRDLAGVMAFPDHPARSAYIENSERFFQIADGEK